MLGAFNLCDKPETAFLEQLPSSCSSWTSVEQSLSYANPKCAEEGELVLAQHRCMWTPRVPVCVLDSDFLGKPHLLLNKYKEGAQSTEGLRVMGLELQLLQS